jgi:hypothetical protein
MTFGDNAKAVLLDILRVGICRLMNLDPGHHGEACRIEAYHLHNIPEIIQSGEWDRLLYYYYVERPEYVVRANENPEALRPQIYVPLWRNLFDIVGTELPADHKWAGFEFVNERWLRPPE